ncbi:MAG: PEPxxWA-CTERM sorting domain-containing protein, partial [Sphingomonadales bacterium]|nr:PEPxxWA-CTERM sorting domain-containing protein [Sphingomonadales bacterium]
FSNGKANFFIDDTATSQGEASAGYIQSLTLFDSPTQTAAVPEPATWALMMAGFGLVGAALRRRKAIAAYA